MAHLQNPNTGIRILYELTDDDYLLTSDIVAILHEMHSQREFRRCAENN